MGKKKHDVAPPETEAAEEASAAADRPEVSAATSEISGATVSLQPAVGQPAGEPAQPDDGAQTGEDGNDVLVADAVLKGQGDGEAAAQLSENQQDSATPGTGDPNAAAGAAGAGQGSAAGAGNESDHGANGNDQDDIHRADIAGNDRDGSVDDDASGAAQVGTNRPDLGDVSADAGEAEADDILTKAIWRAFDNAQARIVDQVYNDRAFPTSGFAGAAAALLAYYLPDTKIGPVFSHPEAETMAAFVRANPDAPLLAMWKQVELKHKLPATIPNNADMLALTVFHAVCHAVIAYEKAEAADQAEREAREIPTATWHGEQSFQVQASGFEATGFTPR